VEASVNPAELDDVDHADDDDEAEDDVEGQHGRTPDRAPAIEGTGGVFKRSETAIVAS
jgi:hypothetical protein